MEINDLYQKYLETGKVSTDSRQITSGSVFFALRGPRFNANEFAAKALSDGASCAVIDDPAFQLNERTVLVKDSLEALQQLARHHREQLKIPFIGLTGSNGKTTSKELVNVVLSKKMKTLATEGNLNNHIGVPLTVLSINSSHDAAIVEMGANHLGEIAALCEICRPTHGFITNIGKAHIGTFGGFDNIVRGKSELYQFLLTNGGVVFINSRDPILANMAKRFRKPVFYPAKGDYYHCEVLAGDEYLQLRTENGETIKTRLVGNYNFDNAAVALAIGKYFDVDSKSANRAVAEYEPGNMRSQLIRKGTNAIILDAYNANPSSMEAALTNLSALKASRKVAILGDMFELEGDAKVEHRRIGEILNEKKIGEAYLCGPLMQSARISFPGGKYFESRQQLMESLKTEKISGATILIKGSRGMKMEEIMEVL